MIFIQLFDCSSFDVSLFSIAYKQKWLSNEHGKKIGFYLLQKNKIELQSLRMQPWAVFHAFVDEKVHIDYY